jgi:hypothetical protein
MKTNDQYGISLAQSRLALIASREGKHAKAIQLARQRWTRRG